MKIPIQNIYYLLSYAWNKLDESQIVSVDKIDNLSIIDLLAKVLANGMAYLLRLGLDRNYIPQLEEMSTIRGRIDINTTLKTTYFAKPSVYCHYDELDHNILHNKIIKTTLNRLIGYKDLDTEINKELIFVYRKLSDIQLIPLAKRHFGLVQLHSNNSFYDFLLKICELLHEIFFISEDDGSSKFKDFIRDEHKMRLLFEEFVRNFYKKEQKIFKVSRRDIKWDVVISDQKALEYLPKMQTDIYLESPKRKVIIDTKFSTSVFDTYYDKKKIKTANLYQLHAYLSNIDALGKEYESCEGILLYPVVEQEESVSFSIKKHRVSIETINLNQDWQGIYKDLKKIIE